MRIELLNFLSGVGYFCILFLDCFFFSFSFFLLAVCGFTCGKLFCSKLFFNIAGWVGLEVSI